MVSRKASCPPRTPPAEAAGRIARVRRGLSFEAPPFLCMDLIQRVRAGGLLAPGRPVVVLLSGGRDSVCLLDLAVRIAGAEAVTALHCDYGLRAASADDAAHCGALCERLGAAVELRRPRRAPRAGARPGRARDARATSDRRRSLAPLREELG